MKFTKMSLVAALLIGSSAFAIDNVKVSGDAKLYYATADESLKDAAGIEQINDSKLFTKDSSIGQAALGLGATADLLSNVSAGVHATVLSTLGLENNLVSGTWAGNISLPDAPYDNQHLQGANGTAWWIDQAWLATTVGKTTGKIGRMELDTPLAFTEKWNIAENTFEAAVLINQDIPDTTVVAAYVGGSNGYGENTVNNAQNGQTPFVGYTTYNSGASDMFNGLVSEPVTRWGGAGAYAVGVVNNSFKPLTAQAWYYNVKEVAKAYWLQADLDASSLGVKGLLAGVQYANMKLNDDVTVIADGSAPVGNLLSGDDDLSQTTDAYAFMLGYALKDVVTVKGAYSQVADDGVLTIQNTATGAQSKLYTEAWWNYGVVGQAGAKSYMLNATAAAAGVDFLAQYTHSDVDHKGYDSKAKFDEFALTASKSFGPLDTTLAYVYSKLQNGNNGNVIHGIAGEGDNAKYTSNMIQAYLTLNF